MLGKVASSRAKVAGVFITLSIIILLVMAGPANAFSVELGNFREGPFIEQGDQAVAEVTITVQSEEALKDSTNVELIIDPVVGANRLCIFSLDEVKISGCDDVLIDLKTSTASFGYGYGYGYGYGFTDGKIVYLIGIDTSNLELGHHRVLIKINGVASLIKEFIVVAPEEPEKNVPEHVNSCESEDWDKLVKEDGESFVSRDECVEYTAKRMCREGGWRELERLDDTKFNRENQCVEYFIHIGNLQNFD